MNQDTKPTTTQTAPQRLSDDVLAGIVRRLVDALAPRAIYLFGSHAYGAPREESDIDLMIVAADDDELSLEYLKRAYACLRGCSLPIELHFRAQAQLTRRGTVATSLERDILTRGKLLYAA